MPPSAVAWARRRFPDSKVDYVVADALAPPAAWTGAFDFVLESYTLQVLPPELRAPAAHAIAATLAPAELRSVFAELELVAFEDFLDDEAPPVRRLRAQYRRP